MSGTCFLIGPYGAENSKERLWSDFVLKEIVRPACGEQFHAQRTIDDPGLDPSGTINAHILEALDAADIVCADLTDHNANAFYELGVRYARDKPFILLCRRDTKLPFDVQAYPTLIVHATYVPDENMYAINAEAKATAIRTLSERIKSLEPRLKKAQNDAAGRRTSESHFFKFYKWTTQYSLTIADDWLAKQTAAFRSAVAAYEDKKGDAGIGRADEVLPAYTYTVEFKRLTGTSFVGELQHPDTGTLVGRARLNAAYGF